MFAIFHMCCSVTWWTYWTACKANAGLFEFTECIRNLNSSFTLTLWYCMCCAVKITVIPLNSQFLYHFSEVYATLWNRRNKSQRRRQAKNMLCFGLKKSDWMSWRSGQRDQREWIWNGRHENFSGKIKLKMSSKICFIEGAGLKKQYKIPKGKIRTEDKLGRKK